MSYSLFRSSLPDGLYLTQHGEIEGTPTNEGMWYVDIMDTPEAGEDYANTAEFEFYVVEDGPDYTIESLPATTAPPSTEAPPETTLPHNTEAPTEPTQVPTEPAEPQSKGNDSVTIAAIAGGSAVAVAGIGAYVFLKVKGLIK